MQRDLKVGIVLPQIHQLAMQLGYTHVLVGVGCCVQSIFEQVDGAIIVITRGFGIAWLETHVDACKKLYNLCQRCAALGVRAVVALIDDGKCLCANTMSCAQRIVFRTME
jgi:L-amino acid N-acyltransferase YncA